ncbi:Exonuclease SbcD [Dehalobacter sp. UNSWDHB]|jgi:exonuclease SbcD|uniref:exonuclease SbcCD subunit D n=1 Tax=unclassified Dehalobacter TaxID=2635733 RepID=UPI00028BB868|nr:MULTISPECIES: exonuclease SbcCD subunit D [unclassified Dehalobacter]AFV01686.1 Exonuclease SbcD [Dehalobacter sp. DCA]AFV04724.1 Exonuclease SbcD [Dehalobacter sp. CF]EQB21547.1 Exonuclease SbcD [Dehalobacter sp. UNSWDHB]
MKLLHTADLHIGKRVNEFSMLEDQKIILDQILRITDEVQPDGLLLAGDIYDKSVPPGEAVGLLDEFLTELVARKLQIFLISGNHDSPERLNFGSRILQNNGLHIAGTFDGSLKHISLRDIYGPVHIYLLPYVKPAFVQAFYPGQDIASYEDAVRAVIASSDIDTRERNILVAHQFITSGSNEPERCDSETISVGGLNNIDASVFEAFDYVALGHLHGPQCIGRETVRYAGSPLKYSFSEARQQKSVTILEFAEKGKLGIHQIPLTALRDLREIKGPLAELLRTGTSQDQPSEDYIRAILTDENEIYDAIGQLRQVYPNIMRLDFANSRSRQEADSQSSASGDVACKSRLELFEEFYLKQNNQEMSEEQQKIMQDIIEQTGGDRR